MGLLELVASPTTVPRVLGIGHVPAFAVDFFFFADAVVCFFCLVCLFLLRLSGRGERK